MRLRLGETRDSDDLFVWRNDPQTRVMSLSSTQVAKSDHQTWFHRKLVDENCHILIAEEDDDKIGVVRFDIAPELDQAEVSINLNPDFRGKKLSQILLEKGVKLFREQCDVKIYATVRESNLASRKIFEANGFTLVSNGEGILRYILDR